MIDTDLSATLDMSIREINSFLLYKRGKAPLGDIDPPKRIKKGIWRDEGVDMTLLLEGRTGPPIFKDIFVMDTLIVKVGFFRKKKEHLIATEIRKLDHIKTLAGENPGIFLGSSILHPLAFMDQGDKMNSVVDTIKVERRPQTFSSDLSADKALRRSSGSEDIDVRSEDLLKLFKKKVPKDMALVSRSGMSIRDLPSLFDHLFAADDDDLASMISNGELSRFAGDGLKSQTMQALFKDLSLDPEGQEETPGSFRKRFGRWTLESPLGDRVVEDIVPRILSRMISCSSGEAQALSESVAPLIDPRSTSILTEMVFKADMDLRPFLIKLLGMTEDRAAQETLKRLMEYSSIEEDRASAKEALRYMGVDMEK